MVPDHHVLTVALQALQMGRGLTLPWSMRVPPHPGLRLGSRALSKTMVAVSKCPTLRYLNLRITFATSRNAPRDRNPLPLGTQGRGNGLCRNLRQHTSSSPAPPLSKNGIYRSSARRCQGLTAMEVLGPSSDTPKSWARSCGHLSPRTSVAVPTWWSDTTLVPTPLSAGRRLRNYLPSTSGACVAERGQQLPTPE